MLTKTQIKKLNVFLARFITSERHDKMLNVLKDRTRHVTIALEDIFQPHNISAVLRSCDGFGISSVHIIENKNKFQVNPDVALGTEKWVEIKKYDKNQFNTPECIDQLKKQGYQIVATALHKNSISLQDVNINQKTALLFGTELNGLSDYAMEQADFFMNIPMFGFVESFNISVSVAICLFYLKEKLINSDIPWQMSEEERESLLYLWLKNSVKSSPELVRKFLNKQAI